MDILEKFWRYQEHLKAKAMKPQIDDYKFKIDLQRCFAPVGTFIPEMQNIINMYQYVRDAMLTTEDAESLRKELVQAYGDERGPGIK